MVNRRDRRRLYIRRRESFDKAAGSGVGLKVTNCGSVAPDKIKGRSHVKLDDK